MLNISEFLTGYLDMCPSAVARRVCTGQRIAKNSLFINIVRMLRVFYIRPKIRLDGREVLVDDMVFTNEFLSRPLLFECPVVPRDRGRAKVIRRAEADKDLASILAKGKLTLVFSLTLFSLFLIFFDFVIIPLAYVISYTCLVILSIHSLGCPYHIYSSTVDRNLLS